MYSPLGQNWGFPIYRWAALAAAGYAWWVERLRCAARYYGAYRLDHILGFFRIWAIPTTETTALMGRPLPAVPITSADLEAACFPPDRIRWLSEPHVATRTIEAANHGDYLATHGLLRPLMNRIGAEELWLFKPDVHGDCDIFAHASLRSKLEGRQTRPPLPGGPGDADIIARSIPVSRNAPVPSDGDSVAQGLPPDVAAALVGEWRNRALIPLRGADGLPTGTYTPAWTYEASRAWQSLSEAEKGALLGVFAAASARQEALWETQARAILTALTAATSMIPCGEDLGVDLACLPRVLADEGILALRVVRWARKWGQKADADGVDSPYAPFAAYPPLSVVTTSVHDSSTLREWWLTEGGGADYLRCFAPPPGVTAAAYTPETARFLLTGAKSAPSALFIPPLQDLLGLTPRYTPPTPVAERINVPGTVSPTNWTYRLPVPTAELVADEELVGEIKRLSE
jgi:4-alpha-glucanotransferase